MSRKITAFDNQNFNGRAYTNMTAESYDRIVDNMVGTSREENRGYYRPKLHEEKEVRVRAFLNRTTTKQRIICDAIIAAEDGLSTEDLAKATGMSADAVKGHLKRLRADVAKSKGETLPPIDELPMHPALAEQMDYLAEIEMWLRPMRRPVVKERRGRGAELFGPTRGWFKWQAEEQAKVRHVYPENPQMAPGWEIEQEDPSDPWVWVQMKQRDGKTSSVRRMRTTEFKRLKAEESTPKKPIEDPRLSTMSCGWQSVILALKATTASKTRQSELEDEAEANH
jgi:hypothetical protein